jgi:hypothetical protein
MPGVGNHARYFLATYEHELNSEDHKTVLSPHQMVEEAWKAGELANDNMPLHDLVNGLCPPHGEIELCVCLRGPSNKARWYLDGETKVLLGLEEKVRSGCFYDFTYGDKTGSACTINENNMDGLVENVLVALQENAKQAKPL